MKLTHGSLFSGIGGFDLAAEWAGFENLFHCEYNTFGKQVLEYHFPNSDSYGDITTTDFTKYRGQITVLTGGFPCQPFSVAGKRKGTDDNRYLWPQMLRVIREIRPTWVIGENVVGIASMVQPSQEVEVASQTSLFGESDHKRVRAEQEYVIETICADLEREGYSVQPLVIPACAIGAPHRRDRVWFLARLADNTYSGSDLRESREDAKEKDEEWLQERNEIREFDKPSCVFWNASNTNGERCNDRIDNRRERQICSNEERNTEKDKSEWNKRECGISKDGTTSTNTKCNRSDEIYHEMESEQSNGHEPDSKSQQRTSSNTTGKQGEWVRSEQHNTSQSEEREFRGSFSTSNRSRQRPNWENFPTQPPIYTRDDGFSYNMAGCTISESKWREESVKACGNAIVPQVAFEIFKAIKKIID